MIIPKAISKIFFDGSAADGDPDRIIVERVQNGDVAAFNVIVTRYRQRIYGTLYHITANHEDAADLAQDTFLRAFRSIQRFRGKSAFSTWLYRIAINTALTQIRKNRLKHFFSFDAIDENAPVAKDVLDALADKLQVDRTVLARELQEKINESMQMLPTKARAAAVLSLIDGLSTREIADIMECTDNTVRKHLEFAKERLEEMLRSYLE
jgi:RNA polymerase sigma-70 factor, ECF subfamily